MYSVTKLPRVGNKHLLNNAYEPSHIPGTIHVEDAAIAIAVIVERCFCYAFF